MTGALAVLGDVNKDGYDDLIQIVAGSNPYLGIWTFSGKDGATLRIRTFFSFKYALTTVTAAGDMNGDGCPDYAATLHDMSWKTNFVEVRSGCDDRLLWRVPGSSNDLFGLYAILGNLDVDGDGRPDLLVAAERENNFRGAVHVFSNRGKLLYRLTLPGVTYLGMSLARVGDVDGDKCDDFVTGAVESVGVAVLVSGRTGKVLLKGYGERDSLIGHSVTGCGDLDGDGVPDFAAGTWGSLGERGMVRAFSGKTGKTLFTWVSSSRQYGHGFGTSIAGEVDLDRDGVPDVVVTATAEFNHPRRPGAVYVFSGRDGAIIHRLEGFQSECVKTMRRQPGHPFPLFAVTDPSYGSLNIGRLMVYRGSPEGVSAFGASCRGTLTTFPKVGVRDLGAKGARFTVFGAAPSAPAVLMVGLSRDRWGGIRLPLPLDPWGYPSCLLFTSVEFALVTKTGSNGFASLDLPLPLSKTGPLTLYGQWLSAGAGTMAPGGVSDALTWRIK